MCTYSSTVTDARYCLPPLPSAKAPAPAVEEEAAVVAAFAAARAALESAAPSVTTLSKLEETVAKLLETDLSCFFICSIKNLKRRVSVSMLPDVPDKGYR
jgi:hypothetical protein